jgi:hypothetical protein
LQGTAIQQDQHNGKGNRTGFMAFPGIFLSTIPKNQLIDSQYF